uniref:Uncharacterized protein n=1 Tax=Leersia perrieri TaxID=77586 RepID=A0A0D9WER8_9ORYZ
MQRGLTHADEQISTSPKHIRLQVQTPRLLLPRLWLAATHPICFARRQERSGGWRRAAARPEFSLNSRDSAIYPTAVQEAGAQCLLGWLLGDIQQLELEPNFATPPLPFTLLPYRWTVAVLGLLLGWIDQSRKQSKLATASFSIEVQAFRHLWCTHSTLVCASR